MTPDDDREAFARDIESARPGAWLETAKHRPQPEQLAVVWCPERGYAVRTWAEDAFFGADGTWLDRRQGKFSDGRAFVFWMPLPARPE